MAKYRMIFTDNKQSNRGIMSFVLGLICMASLLYSFIYSYKLNGEIPDNFGAALVITLVMAMVGAVLGVSARLDHTKFKMLPVLGIVVNTIDLVVLAILLGIGVR